MAERAQKLSLFDPAIVRRAMLGFSDQAPSTHADAQSGDVRGRSRGRGDDHSVHP